MGDCLGIFQQRSYGGICCDDKGVHCVVYLVLLFVNGIVDCGQQVMNFVQVEVFIFCGCYQLGVGVLFGCGYVFFGMFYLVQGQFLTERCICCYLGNCELVDVVLVGVIDLFFQDFCCDLIFVCDQFSQVYGVIVVCFIKIE